MAKIKIRFGLDTMTNGAKGKFIAPKLSRLTAPDVPDLSADRAYLLNCFILNFELALTLSNKHRQLVFNVVRKSEDAFEEYCQAASNLRDYLTESGHTTSRYFHAIRHFEHCLAHLYQAVRCMNALSAAWGGERQFNRGDNSILERVCTMHNQIKHMDQRFEKGEFPDEMSFARFAERSGGTKALSEDDSVEIANVPMWLTDRGLECAKASVTYRELAQEVRELCQEAKKLVKIKPGRRKATE